MHHLDDEGRVLTFSDGADALIEEVEVGGGDVEAYGEDKQAVEQNDAEGDLPGGEFDALVSIQTLIFGGGDCHSVKTLK